MGAITVSKTIPSVPDMQLAFYQHTWERYELVCPNIFVTQNSEMDLCGIRKGSKYLDEIEIKITETDFKADFRKVLMINHQRQNKHEKIKNGEAVCNYFSFLIPEGTLNYELIPEYAGLYIASIDSTGVCRIKEVKKAKRLHNNVISVERRYKLAKKMAYRFWRK